MCICCIYVYLLYSYVYLLYYVCIAVLTLDAGLLARSQYSECPATGHLDTGFSWFPSVYKRMLNWFPSFLYLMCICCTMCVLMPDCWLEVSIRKVLRPATSTQVFLGFPVSISEC